MVYGASQTRGTLAKPAVHSDAPGLSSNLLGAICLFGNCIAMALYFVIARRISSKYPPLCLTVRCLLILVSVWFEQSACGPMNVACRSSSYMYHFWYATCLYTASRATLSAASRVYAGVGVRRCGKLHGASCSEHGACICVHTTRGRSRPASVLGVRVVDRRVLCVDRSYEVPASNACFGLHLPATCRWRRRRCGSAR
jgi:hypothetical protein